MRVIVVAGTRPEAIKLAPLILACRYVPDLEVTLAHSGQHDHLFHHGLQAFDIPADMLVSLDAIAGDGAAMETHIRAQCLDLFRQKRPDIVVVQGDTTTAWAAAKTAHELTIPIGHVEAGLRSGDLDDPFPEERNRVAIDAIADLLFAPNERAASNLRAEGVPGNVHVTGNPGIDAVLSVQSRLAGLQAPRNDIIVTLHRRANVGPGARRVCAALKRLRRDLPEQEITVYLHTNPAGTIMREELSSTPGIRLADAVPYQHMVAALTGARLVLSDSGGLQEECPALGVPLLVLRDRTERPEVIEMGGARLVGTDTRLICDTVNHLLSDAEAYREMATPRFPYGKGNAANEILSRLVRHPLPRR